MRSSVNNPTHTIYYLCHLIIFIIGIILIQVGGEYDVIFDSIGTSLAAAAIAGMFIFFYIKYADDLRVSVQMLVTLGLQQAFNVRGLKNTNEYKSRLLKPNKKNIDILGYGLGTFLEEHFNDFESWKNACDVRILLIDPEFPSTDKPLCNQRDIEEGKLEGTLKNEVVNFIDKTKNIIGNGNNGSFSIKYFKCIPNITIFRIDDEILWGPYFVNHLSRDTPMFIVKKGGILYEQIQSQFENIWKDGTFSRDI